jgi:photosystem II stability/assembly factor-like uncharacterized protein
VLTSAALFVIAAVDSLNAWIIGDDDGGYAVIYRTVDGGASWTRQGTADTVMAKGLIDISAPDGMTAWAVGVDETILRTTDGGATWQVMRTSVPNAGPHINGVCAFDSLNAWIAVDHDVMYRTVDGGVTLSEFKIPSSVGDGYHLICVSARDGNVLWVTGISFTASRPFGEVLYTSNGGFNWVRQEIPVDTMLRRISFVGSPK